MTGGRRDHPKHRERGISEDNLEWIWRNRQRKNRVVQLGSVMRDEVTAQGRAGRRERAVFEAINAVVDDLFRDCCTFEGMRGGDVVLLVRNPDSLYHMRVTWHLVLKEHLERSCPGRTIRKITFKLGQGGARFSPGAS